MLIRHLYKSYFVPIRRNPGLNNTRCLFIASIGNPEPEYEGTRHNIGHRFIDQLINIYWKQHLIKEGDHYFKSKRYPNIVLFKSNDSLMNLQGYAISKHYQQFQQEGSKLIILHDELQIAVGKYQIRKPGTSPRGHNGLKSINKFISNDKYTKVAIGIGRPPDKKNVIDYVMTKFKDNELEAIDFEVLPKCLIELEKLVEKDLHEVKIKQQQKQLQSTSERSNNDILPIEPVINTSPDTTNQSTSSSQS
ncbi:peptidyl-tRNA hydrolase-domain-containing protein [Scheffersomyces coipomensis]|uniref:peptidyl-tRNA hydrolase-domain-containing protein n=1 Tax=Scheffersomyces coipomensis TaxID=1788519 RepID=UPI00315CA681